MKKRIYDIVRFIGGVIFIFLSGALLLTILLVAYAVIKLFSSRNKHRQGKVNISQLCLGDVILTGTNKNASSWYIKLSNILTYGIKNKFWTHAALHLGEGKLIEAQPDGIVYNSIDNYLKQGSLIKVYRHKYKLNDVTLTSLKTFCEKAREDGCKYGKIGLIFYVLASFLPLSAGFIFDNDAVDKWCKLDNAYFCSELVAEAYEKAGHKISPYDSWRIKPSDFIRNPFFEEIS